MDEPKRDFYSSIADHFDELTNQYDRARRIETIFSQLTNVKWESCLTLDVGCGSGAVSLQVQQCGGRVIGCDISHAQLLSAKHKGVGMLVTNDALSLSFPDDTFDIVLSSDAIEHTIAPDRAIAEMARVLKPSGKLVLTVPNKAWKWLLNLAIFLKLRPYEGHENFPTFSELEIFIRRSGLTLEQHFGLHPWPFQIRWLHGLSRWVDNHYGEGVWGRWMINQAIVASKQSP